ncbi:MAG: hypothetical protein J5I93_05735 [Pirellulaceae bacterium]|nr:hypothetical protein [Pirellulaceae bacterium]
MQLAIMFDPADLLDIRRAIDHLTNLAAQVDRTVPENRAAVREIMELASGELLRLAHQHFGTDRFSLVTLAERTGREVPSLHSLAANLGRACAQRHVEVFDRHGGQPMELSIRPDVARVISETTA